MSELRRPTLGPPPPRAPPRRLDGPVAPRRAAPRPLAQTATLPRSPPPPVPFPQVTERPRSYEPYL